MAIKDTYFKFEGFLNKFYHSNAFLVLMSVLTLVGWILDNDIFMLIMLSLSIVIFFVCKNTTPFFIFQWLFLFSSWAGIFGLNMFGWRLVFPALLIVSIIFNIIRFKPDFKYAFSAKTIKGFTFSMLLLIIPMSLGGLFYHDRYIIIYLQVVALFTGLALMIGYFMAMSKKYIEDKDAVIKLIVKLMFCLGVIASMQIITTFIRVGSLEAIKAMLVDRKGVYLGWGGSNHVGAILALCIPANFYYMLKCKKAGFLFVIIAFIEFCLLILTRSRGALLFTTIALPVMFTYVIVKSNNKLSIGITAAVLIGATITLMLIFKSALYEVINKMIEIGFNDSGRINLWKEGLDHFKNYPIFGVGWEIGTPRDELSFYPRAYHSMVIQVMACSGIVGLLGYGYYYWTRIRTFIKRRTDATWTIFAGAFLLEAYGMIDPISFFPTTFFIMLIMMSYAVEQALPDEIGRPILFVKMPWLSNPIFKKLRKTN